jgi:hyperosmotically inducible periplasmic protein
MLQKFAILFSAAGLAMTVACAQTDPGITTAVKAKLAADNTVKAYQINVDTASGVVTLTGIVEAPAAKEQAVVLARGTDGVKDVVDHITVNQAAATTQEHVGERAGESIKDATRTAGEKIEDGATATKNGIEKGVDATKDAARTATDKTKTGAEKTGEFVTDAAITTAVKTKLLADGKTPGLKIDVDTKDGVVTLSGTVKTRAEIDKAVADARGTKGVTRVVNDLKVAP